jgi:hypothetical protein
VKDPRFVHGENGSTIWEYPLYDTEREGSKVGEYFTDEERSLIQCKYFVTKQYLLTIIVVYDAYLQVKEVEVEALVLKEKLLTMIPSSRHKNVEFVIYDGTRDLYDLKHLSCSIMKAVAAKRAADGSK